MGQVNPPAHPPIFGGAAHFWRQRMRWGFVPERRKRDRSPSVVGDGGLASQAT